MLLTRVIESHCSHHVMPSHFDAVDVHGQNVVLMERALHELAQAGLAHPLHHPRHARPGNARTGRHRGQHARVFARRYSRHQNLAHARSQPTIALQLLVQGNSYFTPTTASAAQPRLAHLEPPRQQANLSALPAVPEHLSALAPRALLSRDTAGRQLQQQLNHCTPRLVHHRLDGLLAGGDQVEHRRKQLGALCKVGQQPVVIIAPYHGELRFPCCVLGSTLHLAVLLSSVSWSANPILSYSPGKPPPLILQLNLGHCHFLVWHRTLLDWQALPDACANHGESRAVEKAGIYCWSNTSTPSRAVH